jgi:nuclear pore complex protein Nup107
MRLNAARACSYRVPFAEIVRKMTGMPVPDDFSISWFEGVDFRGSGLDSEASITIAVEARNFYELECLVKALDTMETLASLAELSKE